MQDRTLRAKYQELVSEFSPDNGDLLACLHKVQHHFGYIPTEAIEAIARQLRMTGTRVFGTLTFYSEFRTTPPPETLINWCSGPACRNKGGENIRQALEAVLGFGMESNSDDNRVGLHLAQCEGSCEYAPLVWLRYHGQRPENADALLIEERGEVVGRLSVADAVQLARRLKSTNGADGSGGQ